ncbi:MAG: 5-formyltetrahydrofolate cyclo-ligase [Alphaproteobacteria bacterium]
MRASARTTRAAAAKAVPDAADRIAVAVVALARRRRPDATSGYWAIGDEIDVRPALRALVAMDVVVALPVMGGQESPLTFRRWVPGARLKHRMWGIQEPVADAPAVRPELLLVPLLAFDAHGGRLGYGGGYYDRTIAGLRADGGPPILACGVAFAGQEVAEVPCEPYDMRLDAVITEDGLRMVAPEPAGGR